LSRSKKYKLPVSILEKLWRLPMSQHGGSLTDRSLYVHPNILQCIESGVARNRTFERIEKSLRKNASVLV
jgi:hypothetical protein